MWNESSEKVKPLRSGLTTGTCATACALASATKLLCGKTLNTVSITLPKGKTVELQIRSQNERKHSVRSETLKDAGDDPDVTHGATIFVDVSLNENPEIVFKASKGVGTVTRDGLLLPVGEPAINPTPRKMISTHLNDLANQQKYTGGFNVSIGIVNGEQIAQKTMNPRLGIIGGLSILGTTGIVRPFSCSAWIASIHQGIDVAKANRITHIAASTGNTSETAIKELYQLSDIALIEMGDFAGAVLKHLKRQPIEKLSICGGFGKITKLANQHRDLNSRVSAIDFEHIASIAEALLLDNVAYEDDLRDGIHKRNAQITSDLLNKTIGNKKELIKNKEFSDQGDIKETLLKKIKNSNTSIESYNLCKAQNINLGNAVCDRARDFARQILPDNIDVEIFAIDRIGTFIGYAGGDKDFRRGLF